MSDAVFQYSIASLVSHTSERTHAPRRPCSQIDGPLTDVCVKTELLKRQESVKTAVTTTIGGLMTDVAVK